MTAAITQIRGAIPHAGEIGDLVERVFRSQLQELLPERIGVSNGFVVDSKENVSRQMDLILFDRHNTPRIFSSAGAQMFPVECTYACGEIKTDMNSSQLADSFEKCLSYKKLCRSAYHEFNSPLKYSHTLFGRHYDHWQSIFFCIAASSTGTDTLASTFQNLVQDQHLPVQKRIDTIVTLEPSNKHNVLLNASVDERTGIPHDSSIDLLPSEHTKVCSYRAREPWSLFVMLLLRYMTQAPTLSVNMLPYGGNDPY
ncbi:MAG: hypothetical protein OXQ29_19110 [Rhodospirillaceae bacterium]|nr:hypothetical protein [Rhodospirillaceae bacterium]